MFANHQIRHQASSEMGNQVGHCRFKLKLPGPAAGVDGYLTVTIA